MIIHSLSHEMDTTVDVPMASLTGHYMLDAKSLRSDNFDSLPQSKWSDNLIENNGMSITFKEVFQNFRESAKSADLSKIRTRPQSKQERIVDAFNRTEHLLSAGNLRPKSKYRINDNVHTEDVSSAVLHSHISEDNIRKIFSVNTDHEIVAAERRISPEKENLVENDTNNASEKSVIVNNLDIPLSKKGNYIHRSKKAKMICIKL